MWRQKQPKFIAHVLHHTSVYVNSVHFSSVLQHFSHACTSLTLVYNSLSCETGFESFIFLFDPINSKKWHTALKKA